jgi:hypothetical protein
MNIPMYIVSSDYIISIFQNTNRKKNVRPDRLTCVFTSALNLQKSAEASGENASNNDDKLTEKWVRVMVSRVGGLGFGPSRYSVLHTHAHTQT